MECHLPYGITQVKLAHLYHNQTDWYLIILPRGIEAFTAERQCTSYQTDHKLIMIGKNLSPESSPAVLMMIS